MTPLARQLIQTASLSRTFLDKQSRREAAAFIRSKKHPSGGFCGRDELPDLYYTFFAVAALRALGSPVPFLSLRRFTRPFGSGGGLDLAHLVCLILLFPRSGKKRRQLFQTLETHSAETAYDVFLKSLASPKGSPKGSVLYFNVSGVTPNMAAAAVLNGRPDGKAVERLLGRYCAGGGFRANAQAPLPDLLSTGVALVALKTMGANLDEIREPCLGFVESLWRDGGGFGGHDADLFEDTEYVFYALLSIGCLIS